MKILKVIEIGLLSLLIVLILATGIFAIINVDFSNPDDLDDFLDNKYDKLDIAGMAFAVIDENGIAEFYSNGYMDVENKKPIDQNTIFMMASISKTVTSCAVMQLSEQGLIDIDADVSTYLPFEVRNPKHPTDVITIRMLLTHTSSIRENWDVYDSLYTIDAGGGDPDVSLAEFNSGYLTKGGKYYDADLNFLDEAPGTHYEYSNCGYALLGYLVECVSNQTFSEYCNENIIDPLDMENTAWNISELDEAQIAIPYEGDTALPHYSFATYSDGALHTSANDFSKFLRMMMNYGELDGVRILKEETIKEMLTPQVPELYEYQGITWDLQVAGEAELKYDHYVFGHSGGDPGVSTFTIFNPDTKKAALFMVNSDFEIKELITYRQIVKRMVAETR